MICVLAYSLNSYAQVTCTPSPTLATALTIGWDAPIQPSGVTTIAYVLERQTDQGPWEALPDVWPTVTIANDQWLAVGHTYTYRVAARGMIADGSTQVSGWGTNGTPAPCKTILEAGAPGQVALLPTPFDVTPDCGQQCMRVSWESNDPTQQVRIERRTYTTSTWTYMATVGGTGYADSNLNRSYTYCYRIRYANNTSYTPTVCATTGK